MMWYDATCARLNCQFAHRGKKHAKILLCITLADVDRF